VVSYPIRKATSVLVTAALLAASGCARVVGKEHQRQAWGPIHGTVESEEARPRITIINHANVSGDASRVLSTGGTAVSARAWTSARIESEIAKSAAPAKKPVRAGTHGRQSAPLARDTADENPFNHPPATLPLPEVLPSIGEIEVAPLPNRFALEPKPVPQQIAKAPSAPAPIRETVIPVPAAPAEMPSQVEPRARLAEPQTSLPAALQPAPKAEPRKIEPIAETSPLATAAGTFAHYQFSFAHEIWLLIIILGGVFATLWFRLEYDFGSRGRGRR
jgi:hypothetical protein